MTTLSLGTAFESQGDANNGYHSATFDRFVGSLENIVGLLRLDIKVLPIQQPMVEEHITLQTEP